MTEFPILTNGGASVGITTGPDDALWFTEIQSGKIGRITTRGHVTEFALPTANARPVYIARGSDNTLWFTESQANKIGLLTIKN